MYISDKSINIVKQKLLEKYGESCKFRIERGVSKVAFFWQEQDGSAQQFIDFCQQNFIGDETLLEENLHI